MKRLTNPLRLPQGGREFFLLFLLFILPSLWEGKGMGLFAQDDMDKLLEQAVPEEKKNEKVFATFKTTKVINAQSTETVKGGCLDFRITHRFGNIASSTGGVHTMWGFDNSEDIRFAFDYGITNNMTIGIARNKMMELMDGTFKWKFLEQTTNNKVPLSVCLYENAGATTMREREFYVDVDTSVKHNDAHRFIYTSQLVLARKFNWRFSLEVIPGFTHRNFVKQYVNTGNNAIDENDFFSLGGALRFKITKRFSILLDYFHPFSNYRTKNSNNPFFDPIALGIEIETGGHVFHIDLTNASGINENNFIPYTTDDWLQGGFKLGFNISRVFTIVKPKPQVQ